MNKGYIINRDSKNKEITYIEYETKTGFDIKPRNQVKKSDSIDVSKVVFLYPSFIEKIITKKIDEKYKQILSLVGKIASDDDDDEGFLIGTLGEVERFRSILKRKYAKFLEEEKLGKLNRKLDIMKKELKKIMDEYEEERELNKTTGKSR